MAPDDLGSECDNKRIYIRRAWVSQCYLALRSTSLTETRVNDVVYMICMMAIIDLCLHRSSVFDARSSVCGV